jgi:hypothetical protein
MNEPGKQLDVGIHYLILSKGKTNRSHWSQIGGYLGDQLDRDLSIKVGSNMLDSAILSVYLQLFHDLYGN